jgi:fibronectin-binding autotransporter adhesin
MSKGFRNWAGAGRASTSTHSKFNRRKAALALTGAAMLVPFLGASQQAKATLTWDPTGSLGTTPGGTGNWDTTAGNNVWWNGTADISYPTPVDTVVFTGATSSVTVDTNVTTPAIIFANSGDTIGGTSTISLTGAGILTAPAVSGVSETISAPVTIGSSTNSIDGMVTFGGPILGSGAPILTGATTNTATFAFSGDMSLFTGKAITVSGGNTLATLNHLVTFAYSSTAGGGVLGDSTTQLQLGYAANLSVSQTLNVFGALVLTGGGQQGLGDLSKNGETVSGTANINVGWNPNTGANTTVTNGVSSALPPTAFIGANVGAFLTNNLTSGHTLTIGQAGAVTDAALSGTNAGRMITFAGSGATVINSQLVDGNKSSLNYVNSNLAYNGSGSVTVTNPANNYKGATVIEQGTVKLGATNALPTGQGLPATSTGGTPGLVLFGDLDPTKNAGGVLDLAGFNQTVSGLGVEAAGTVPTALQNATWTISNNTAGNASSLVTIAGFAPYNSGLAVGEAITVAGTSGTIISLANGGGTSQTMSVGLSFNPTPGSYTISGGTVVLGGGAATASSQIIGSSSTTSNSTLTFAGGTHGGAFLAGEGVGPTSTFGGIIKDSVNGGTMKVALNVAGGTLNLTGNSTYTGGTTVNGGLNGAVLNVQGLIANDASGGVLLGGTVTFGTADTIISRNVPNGSTYAGLGATAMTGLNTTLDLLQGANTTNGAALSVSMEDRSRGAIDLADLPAGAQLASDVFKLNGLVIGGGASGQTDPYALQMSYVPSTAVPGSPLFLASTDDAMSGQYANAVAGNFGVGGSAVTNYAGSYAQFAAANGITDANVANYLGSWGVDTTSDTVWAVINHDSLFAVESVPEPTSLGLVALAGVGLMARRSRRKA